MQLDGAQVLAWRLRRHALLPAAAASAVEVAQRVLAMRGWPLEGAELAVGVRLADPRPGTVEAALEARELVRSYAWRGGSYVMTHATAAVALAVRRTSRVWESARYQKQGRFELEDWAPWREAVREALAAGPATRAEIWEHARRDPALRRLEQGASGAGSDSLFKPLHWWGDICFGPERDGVSTFRLLDEPAWGGTMEPEDAGPQAVLDHLAAYGPSTEANLRYWLTEGLSAPWNRVEEWVGRLGDQVVRVELDGEQALARALDLEDMLSAPADDESLALVPAFDPWVNGPGTAEERIVPPARRALVSRGSSLVLRAGVVVGTWKVRAKRLEVELFVEAFGGAVPSHVPGLEEATRRVAAVLGRELEPSLATA